MSLENYDPFLFHLLTNPMYDLSSYTLILSCSFRKNSSGGEEDVGSK